MVQLASMDSIEAYRTLEKYSTDKTGSVKRLGYSGHAGMQTTS